MGIAACLLMALYIQDELSYDQHYRQQDWIYRVVVEAKAELEKMREQVQNIE